MRYGVGDMDEEGGGKKEGGREGGKEERVGAN